MINSVHQVRHAVLNDSASDTAKRSLFYLKKAAGYDPHHPNSIANLHDQNSLVLLMRTLITSSCPFISVPDDDKRLTALKDELSATNSLKVNGYTKPAELASRVLADFKAIIDRDFPLSSIPGKLHTDSHG